ncbi:MAG: mechanosensitive ion channel [Gammaproteobacteria bacterium]|nr:mechanosensitive ion channel [Gammaproteobacteria bacterium]MCP5136313.1 mechanosensitive ion channel [Gammaproteobacteria bacterium]
MDIDILRTTLQQFLSNLWGTVGTFLPKLFAAIVVLGLGWIAAKLAARAMGGIARRAGLDRLVEKQEGVKRTLRGLGLSVDPSRAIGLATFWLILLLFLISAAETLGLGRLTATIDAFALFVPRVASAFLILVLGLSAAGFARRAAREAAAGLGAEHASAIGGLVYGALAVLVISLSIGQLDIETGLLNTVIAIVLIAAAAAIALSLGLGTREIAAKLVAGIYARENYRPGAWLRIGETEGVLLHISGVEAVLETAEGERVHIPTDQLLTAQVAERPER